MTEHPLGRIEAFDERSRAYPVSDVLRETAMPTTAKAWPMYTWNDQGQEGACVGFAWANEVNAVPERHGLANEYARRIYWAAQKIDWWPGGAYPDRKPDEPYYEGTSVLAGAQVIRGLGYMQEFRWAFSLEEACAAIVQEGPVVFGMPWHFSMYSPGEQHEVKPDGRIVGGHAILGRGFYPAGARVWNPLTQRYMKFPYAVVRLRNSWGRYWKGSMNGDCFVSVDNLRELLRQRGETCVPVGRKRLVPRPPPP
jgi:hypothetical protein